MLGRFIAVIIIGTEITSLRLSRGRNWVCQPIGFHQNRSLTPNFYQAGMWLTKPTSELRHSFTAILVEPVVSHRGFGQRLSPFMTINLWPWYSIVLLCPPSPLRGGGISRVSGTALSWVIETVFIHYRSQTLDAELSLQQRVEVHYP